jgi:hypothetical protein
VFSETGDQQLACPGGLQLDGTNQNDPTETQCTINLTFNFGGLARHSAGDVNTDQRIRGTGQEMNVAIGRYVLNLR